MLNAKSPAESLPQKGILTRLGMLAPCHIRFTFLMTLPCHENGLMPSRVERYVVAATGIATLKAHVFSLAFSYLTACPKIFDYPPSFLQNMKLQQRGFERSRSLQSTHLGNSASTRRSLEKQSLILQRTEFFSSRDNWGRAPRITSKISSKHSRSTPRTKSKSFHTSSNQPSRARARRLLSSHDCVDKSLSRSKPYNDTNNSRARNRTSAPAIECSSTYSAHPTSLFLLVRNMFTQSSRTTTGNSLSRYGFIPLKSGQVNSFKRELLRLINSSRRKHGARPLHANSALDTIARLHTEDQARTDRHCTHIGSDGSRLWERVQRGGYKYKLIGENVARGHTSPTHVHLALMDSPGHAKNVVHRDFVEVGLYVCKSHSGLHFWTELFGVPK